MKKLLVLAVVLMLVLSMTGCGGKGGDMDSDWNDSDDYWNDPDGYGDQGYDGPKDSQGSGEFYDVYARGLELMGMFKELKFSRRSANVGTDIRVSASFSLIGDAVVDGQNTMHFQCTYDDNGYRGELEIWVNENLEPVQALVDGVIITGQAVGPATLEFDYVLGQLGGNHFVGLRNEEELQEDIKALWEIDKLSQEARDFGSGTTEVTRYELSQLIDPMFFDYSRTDYLVWEYANIGSGFLCTKSVETNDKYKEQLTELTVERVIPH